MKKTIVFAVMFVMLFAVAQAVNKNDFTFSVIGGSERGKFNLATNFLYAGEFGKFFIQAAGFANLGQTKEYGGSFGLGVLTDQGGDLYLFADSLYAYGKFWTQLRPTVRLRFSWLSLTGFYALPLTKPTIQIDEQEVGTAQYWGGELNLVPVPWGRVYGNLLSVNGIYTYKFGAEVRLVKWVSVSGEWNKANSGIYSKWNNGDFRVAVSLLFGNQQQSFSPTTHRVQVASMYPVLVRLVRKNSEIIKPEPPKFVDVRADYYRPAGIQGNGEWVTLCRSWTGYIYEDMIQVEKDHYYLDSAQVRVNSQFYKNMDKAHYVQIQDGRNILADGIFMNGVELIKRWNTANGPLAYFWLDENGGILQ